MLRIDTKEKREAIRQSLFNSHIEAGFKRETYKSLEIFTKEDGGKYYLHLYSGNSTKDLNKYYYRDAARLEEVIKNAKSQYDRNEEYKQNKIKNDKLSREEAEKKAKAGEIVQASTRKSTVLLKKYIKEKFNIDCSVKSEFYSMGCSLNISYNLGPDDEALSDIKSRLEYGRFDGMQDLSYTVDVLGIIVDGFKLENLKYVNIKQEISEDFLKRAALMLSDSKMFNVPVLLPDFSNFHSYFGERFGSANTWGQLIYQTFRKRNFITQDESKVKLISCHYDENSNGDIYFKYSVEGLDGIFDTRQYILPNNEKKTAEAAKTIERPNFETVQAETGKINIIDYSEKAIAVIGDTKPIKEILRELGGRFNFRLSCGAGWIFPKTMQNKVIETIKANKKKEVHEEIQKTINFFVDTDIKLLGSVSEETKEAARVQNCDINGVQEYDNLKAIEAAAESGKVISLYNLSNILNDNKKSAVI